LIEEAQSLAGRQDLKEKGHQVRFLAVRCVEEAQCLTDRQDIRRKVGD
jgi:hypothetical protein